MTGPKEEEVMMKKFAFLGIATMMAVAAASPASAESEKGYRIRYIAQSRDFCVTPLIASEAQRLNIALYRTECHTMVAWAKMGVTFSHG